MGQKIVVNGEAKQLPKVFKNEKELREFLDEVLERALQTPKYAGEVQGERSHFDL
ncbi:hypothetical protein [Thermococcus stetteri]|uniref:hypothetical protein n=1 Tax=Thermococcus stetteri TaxID=49900 RepID=UPI001AE7B2CB|nr:hypothetical protein [Thermococcus stetteri]MBP1912121.1 hypothetical protein [Thermococcus stetteri]